MEFVKVHSTGNHFVLLPDLDDRLELDAGLTRALCDRHRGVGGDGVIRLGRPRTDADVFMDYRNADGSVSQMCGNGVRCVAKYMADRGLAAGDAVRVDTRGGVKVVHVVDRHDDGRVARVRVDMGPPEPTGEVSVEVSPLRLLEDLGPSPGSGGVSTVTAERRLVQATTLSMGNPHAVLRVADVRGAPVSTWGPVIECDAAFPDRTNVEFVTVPARDRVEGRIWERGVGETQASGTGAAAMAVAAHLWDLADRHVTVALPGGELDVEWAADTLYVTGEAVEVASGRLHDAWLARLQDRA